MAKLVHPIVLLPLLWGVALGQPARAEPDAPAAPAAESPLLASPGADLTLYALSLNGTAYRYGGRDPASGMDCSGFVGHVFREVLGIDLPRSAEAISRLGHRIGLDELKPGDLVFFNTLRRAFSHVGIYLGNQQFIHASSSKTGNVMISSLQDAYWAKRFNGARRIGLPEK